MSYSISISGHKDVASPEEGKAFEESIVEDVKKCVASLEGVTHAQLSGGNIGAVSLMPDKDAEG